MRAAHLLPRAWRMADCARHQPGPKTVSAWPYCFVCQTDQGKEMPMSTPEPVAGERADLLQSLARQRNFLRYTTRGLTDDQARSRPRPAT
jgi:hypothetical protein